jgi:Lrp/AsnC family leucine-responsive transcriptional regulator
MSSEQRNNGSQTFASLDGIDRRIVAELYGDARLRVAELGRRVGLSPPAVAERLRRLTDSGALCTQGRGRAARPRLHHLCHRQGQPEHA